MSGRTPSCWCTTGHAVPRLPQAWMNIERQVQQRSMFLPKAGDGTISGIAPGCSSGVPLVAGSANIVSTLASV